MCSVRTNGGFVHDVVFSVLPPPGNEIVEPGSNAGACKPVRTQRRSGPDPKPSKRKVKKASLSTLRKKAWMLFSRYIRYRGGERTEYVECVSCEALIPANAAHAGHFIHCSKQSTLSYDERNVHPQCRNCNFYGMQGEAAIRYTQYMQEEYGLGIVDELLAIKHRKEYLKRADLEAIIEKYKWV